jgi:hypothetical protein
VPIQDIWEQVVGGASTCSYTFNGQAVATRDSSTTLNYTGQRLDGIGLQVEQIISSASAR